MARQPRIVVENVVHHVVARGVDRCAIFSNGYDKGRYLKRAALLAEETKVEIHGYCLLQNHVHFLLTPSSPTALATFIKRLHVWWAGRYNRKVRRSGHLFQGRYYSSPLSDSHYWTALRYVELNPVRAKLVPRPEDWLWSSARTHLQLNRRSFIPVAPILSRIQPSPSDWRELLYTVTCEADQHFRRALPSCRPVGPPDFVLNLEQRFHRRLSLPPLKQTIQTLAA